jgi:hypothetical protein
MQKLIAH